VPAQAPTGTNAKPGGCSLARIAFRLPGKQLRTTGPHGIERGKKFAVVENSEQRVDGSSIVRALGFKMGGKRLHYRSSVRWQFLFPAQQLWQLGDVGSDPRRASSRDSRFVDIWCCGSFSK
jgi:hypothetical protein